MNSYIEATFGPNREMYFEDNSIYEGEQFTACLKIPTTPWIDKSIDFYTLILETYPFGARFSISPIGKESCTAATIEEGFIICPLTQNLTCTGKLKVQLLAHKIGENEQEILEKTGIGKLKFDQSLNENAMSPMDFETMQEQFFKLEKKVENIEFDMDYDYFCAAMGAKLSYVDGETTPLYFPKSGDAVEELIEEILATYIPDERVKHFIVAPAYGGEGASLVVIFSLDGSAIVGRYTGKAILEMLIKEVNGG